ncbi:MAG: histidine phosphatase family protein, partial [Desulfobacterales bacterium]|nr:histidine phosphatase family protein [Desulfobacterales bacterium]
TGIRQCEILGAFFSNTGRRFARVYSGRMVRQIDTAKIVMSHVNGGKEMGPRLMEEFNEYDHMGIIESQLPGLLAEDPSIAPDLRNIKKDRRQFARFFGSIMTRWHSGEHDARGVETYVEYQRRIKKGIEKVVENNGSHEKIAVFTSGGVISVAMQLALDLSRDNLMNLGWHIMNTSATVFKHARGRLNLVSFNSTAHLELEKNPEIVTIN